MKEINRIFFKSLFFILIIFSVNAENKVLSMGSSNAKITIKVFSSLTCPHCANFHTAIFNKLKIEYIDKGLVRFEHHAFPLDLAALNAEIIVRCHVDNNKKFELLEEMYEKQKKWAVGSDINKLNQRIQAQRNYSIESTPTIFINEKKYNGKVNYKHFKKVLKKYL